MKANNFCLLMLVVSVILGWCVTVPGCAQDPLPAISQPEQNSKSAPGSEQINQLMSLVPMDKKSAMPVTFRETDDNVLSDPSASLSSFWQKLALRDKPVRIVHIGDSHVRGHVFPYEMRLLLENDFGGQAVEHRAVTYQTSGIAHETGEGGVVYHIIGVNGATCATFSTPERIDEITSLRPDLVIVSFGTNEAHGRRYSSAEHLASMRQLWEAIRQNCPDAAFLLTTPPGAYRRAGKRGYMINPNTPQVVENELSFAKEHNLAVWDMYRVVGGKKRACLNWSAAGLFQRDKIHFTHEGYKVQAQLFHEAFIKAFNGYVADRME